eukprot:SAG31_NODE_20037_length_585_cov_1.106996_1_plen_23_part_10
MLVLDPMRNMDDGASLSPPSVVA